MLNRFVGWEAYLVVMFCCAQFPIGHSAETDGLNPSVGASVQVATTDGRTLRGQIDARSTPEVLWLSVSQENITITSRVGTDQIVSITAAPPISLPTDSTQSLRAINRHALPDRSDQSLGPVASLSAFARPANWDRDAEIDGLELFLQPLDQFGRMVHASGIANAELTVYRGDARLRGGAVERQSWSIPVSATTPISENAIVVRLPFRGLQPENELDLQPFGDLRIRFSVAGQGVFESTIAGVGLRPFSPTQDLRMTRQIR